jgi:hypothetical protein
MLRSRVELKGRLGSNLATSAEGDMDCTGDKSSSEPDDCSPLFIELFRLFLLFVNCDLFSAAETLLDGYPLFESTLCSIVWLGTSDLEAFLVLFRLEKRLGEDGDASFSISGVVGGETRGDETASGSFSFCSGIFLFNRLACVNTRREFSNSTLSILSFFVAIDAI